MGLSKSVRGNFSTVSISERNFDTRSRAVSLMPLHTRQKSRLDLLTNHFQTAFKCPDFCFSIPDITKVFMVDFPIWIGLPASGQKDLDGEYPKILFPLLEFFFRQRFKKSICYLTFRVSLFSLVYMINLE